MDVEIAQNIVLIGFGTIIFFMYVTAKAFDSIADEIEDKR